MQRGKWVKMINRSSIFYIVSAALITLIAPSNAHGKEMAFRMIYNNHTNVIVADGEITGDTPRVFQRFLDTDPFDGFNFEIHLNSPGGNLIAGMTLGNMIRELGLKSDVIAYNGEIDMPGGCMSACALAYIGGSSRSIGEGSRLGFHQFSSSGGYGERVVRLNQAEIETQMLSGLVQQYIISMGVSGELFSRMSVTPPDRMYIPNLNEMEKLGITSVEAFRGFTLEPWGNGVRASSTYAENAKGRDIVSRVDFVCMNGQQMIILSQPSSNEPLDAGWIRSVGPVGYSISSESTGYKMDYGPQAVSFLTKGQQVAALRTDQRGVNLILSGHSYIRVDIAGAYGNNMGLQLKLTESDKAVIRTAFQICK